MYLTYGPTDHGHMFSRICRTGFPSILTAQTSRYQHKNFSRAFNSISLSCDFVCNCTVQVVRRNFLSSYSIDQMLIRARIPVCIFEKAISEIYHLPFGNILHCTLSTSRKDMVLREHVPSLCCKPFLDKKMSSLSTRPIVGLLLHFSSVQKGYNNWTCTLTSRLNQNGR